MVNESGDESIRDDSSPADPPPSDSGKETMSGPQQVVFLSGDLMFASRVKGAAERAGLEFKLASALPTDAAESIRFVVLDLSTKNSLAATLAAECSQRCPSASLLAYGPHVQAGRLSAARAAGIPKVLTRGQFDQMLGRIFDDR